MRNITGSLSPTGGKVRNRAQNTAIAIQRSRRADTPGSFSTREDVELSIDKGTRGDRIVQCVQQKVWRVHLRRGLRADSRAPCVAE